MYREIYLSTGEVYVQRIPPLATGSQDPLSVQELVIIDLMGQVNRLRGELHLIKGDVSAIVFGSTDTVETYNEYHGDNGDLSTRVPSS